MKRFIAVTILLGSAIATTGIQAYAVEPSGYLTKREVKALIKAARTQEDHLTLARYYRYEAAKLKAEAKDHEEMGAEYFRNPIAHSIPKWPTMGQHCRDLVTYYSNAAKTANEMATMHEEMAAHAR